MGCSGCVEEKADRKFRGVWRRVPKGEKRRVFAVVGSVAGGALGWVVAQETGALVGMFLAGCVGELGGLVRYGDVAVVEARASDVVG